jgi:hypothetical protein
MIFLLLPLAPVQRFGEAIQNGRQPKFDEVLLDAEMLRTAQACTIEMGEKTRDFPDHTSVLVCEREQFGGGTPHSYVVDMPFKRFIQTLENRLHVIGGPQDTEIANACFDYENGVDVEQIAGVVVSFPPEMNAEMRDVMREAIRDTMLTRDGDETLN